MSNQREPPVIPGFYFDPIRKRYFPANNVANAIDSQKKFKKPKKDPAPDHSDIKQNKKNYHEMCKKYLSLTQDPVECLYNGALSVPAEGLDNLRLHGFTVNTVDEIAPFKSFAGPIFNLNLNILHQKTILSNGYMYLITENGLLFKYKYGTDQPELLYVRSSNPLSSNIVYKCVSFLEYKNFLFLHTVSPTNEHILEYFDLEKSISYKEYKHQETANDINDSCCIGPYVCMASKNKLILLKFEGDITEKKVVRIGTIKSDIICIQTYEVTEQFFRLYLGCRNGEIHTKLVDINCLFNSLRESFDKIKLSTIRSIVSLHKGISDGIIYISGLSSNQGLSAHMGNTLLRLDIFLFNEDETTGLTYFDNYLQNLVKDQELFAISNDDRFLIYGTNKELDEQNLRTVNIYSTSLSDNSVSYILNKANNKSTKILSTFYPLPISETLIPMENNFSVKSVNFIDRNKFIYTSELKRNKSTSTEFLINNPNDLKYIVSKILTP
ncbi:hypothetical protein TPHA_0H00480 [Tetrapisispora phaffii CBS 4417]|uniref:Uncharacterized protein n=1 Tax=Tetrapisispora phaffii (strain ATCC 24235 / CBS 4417 / NBRC 1672 / NRRL Y-8282 / UCD 70-5) TaxID=1071381 RepID=G8BWV4_TETPH|nr:hypothetical protein TPHA_0H00480 [Tetrapisispora phaffii CBS 4417]CCE64258.1 hypothetical protein TPHA_0H00480 [Tetrapisispora phaffii CBS 4417]